MLGNGFGMHFQFYWRFQWFFFHFIFLQFTSDVVDCECSFVFFFSSFYFYSTKKGCFNSDAKRFPIGTACPELSNWFVIWKCQSVAIFFMSTLIKDQRVEIVKTNYQHGSILQKNFIIYVQFSANISVQMSAPLVVT